MTSTDHPSVVQATVTKIDERGEEQVADLLAAEEPLEIRLGFGSPHDRRERSLSVTMRTPGHDFDLTLGFLFTEGIVTRADEVESIVRCREEGHQHENENIVKAELRPDVKVDFEKLQRHFYTSSSCGVCGKSSLESVRQSCMPVESELKVSTPFLCALPAKLRSAQWVFDRTGGLHASALFDQDGSLTLVREDVGRHNALDKVIGARLLQRQVPIQEVLLVSGRVSFELIQKAAMAGIPIVASIGAPSSLAVQLAEELHMTLVSFLRSDKLNLYTGHRRIS